MRRVARSLASVLVLSLLAVVAFSNGRAEPAFKGKFTIKVTAEMRQYPSYIANKPKPGETRGYRGEVQLNPSDTGTYRARCRWLGVPADRLDCTIIFTVESGMIVAEGLVAVPMGHNLLR